MKPSDEGVHQPSFATFRLHRLRVPISSLANARRHGWQHWSKRAPFGVLAERRLRSTPAKFDLGGQTLNHWFDGLVMLHRFMFTGGSVAYANRYLQSANYRSQQETGRLNRGEFTSDPC